VNHGDGTVSVIDTATNLVVKTVDVGDEPLGAAVNAAGTRAYVTNQTAPDGTVSVIDTANNSVVATVTVGARASGVAVKLPGDRVYVTNRDDKNVSVIDTAINAVVATVTVGNNPLGIAVDPAGNPAYVVNKGSNNVSVIDTASNTVIATVTVGNDPSQIAVSPNGRRGTSQQQQPERFRHRHRPQRHRDGSRRQHPEGLAIDPSAHRRHSGPNSVSVVDTATNAVTKTIASAPPQRVAARRRSALRESPGRQRVGIDTGITWSRRRSMSASARGHGAVHRPSLRPSSVPPRGCRGRVAPGSLASSIMVSRRRRSAHQRKPRSGRRRRPRA
jgi:YVTN family beta-propeller protein